jgi:hypothetical protein
MISYQKPTVVTLEAASTAIQGLGKRTQTVPDAITADPFTSGLAYDLDE